MSRWKQHMSRSPAEQELAGQMVERMEILEEGHDGNSLKMGCLNCGRKFWFDDQNGGRNAVERNAADGTLQIHAQCPQCRCEWDGDIHTYYTIGVNSYPPASIQEATTRILGNFMPMVTTIFDVVEADDPISAIKMITVPPSLDENFRDGLTIMKCPKSYYDAFQTHKNLQKTGGSVSDFLNSVLGGRFAKNGPNPSNSDPSVQEVINAMNGNKPE